MTSSPQLSEAAAAPAADARESQREGGVTPRVVVFSLLLAVFFGFIIPVIDVKMANTFLGSQHLPSGAVGVLLVMLLVINPLGRLLARLRIPWVSGLRRNEAITVYITCLVSCLVPGHGAENFIVSYTIGPFYYANPSNKWLEFLEQHTPTWMTPALWADGTGTYGEAGRRAVEGWYLGGTAVPWEAWLVPLGAWGSLILAIYISQACFSAMLRAQWAENEALSFPMLRLPLELTEDLDRDDKYGVLGRFFRNPLMWIGFGIAVFIQAMNGLRFYFPDVPAVPMGLPTGPLLSEAPWNQIGGVTLSIYPLAVGLSYLLTSEISFSLWFFFWLMRFQLLAAYYSGFPPAAMPDSVGGGGKLFLAMQQVGAVLMWAAIIMWTGREHLLHIVRRAFGRERAREREKTEMMSYPVAFWGFVFSSLWMLGWTCAAGVRPDVALVLWTIYLILSIVVTRVIIEGGILFAALSWTPLGTIAQITGGGIGTFLSPATIMPAALINNPLMASMRGLVMPSFVQGFKLAHDRKISPRPLLALLLAVTLITLVMGLVVRVWLGYQYGGLGFHDWFAKRGPQGMAGNISTMIKGVENVSWVNPLWIAVGGAATWAMMAARSRFSWFPLHPIGYVFPFSYALQTLWFSIFLGWMFKVTITRFGGSDSYRNATPAFLGLALGDVSMILFWLIIDGWQGRTNHWLVPT